MAVVEVKKLKSRPSKAEWYLELAETVSRRSPCLSRKVGAIVVQNDVVVSVGYNGPPRGFPHCGSDIKSQAVCPRRAAGFLSGEGLHLCPASHGESNAILNAVRVGVSLRGASLYLNAGFPCVRCAIMIVQAGIIEVFVKSLEVYEKVGVSGAQVFSECGVQVTKI